LLDKFQPETGRVLGWSHTLVSVNQRLDFISDNVYYTIPMPIKE